MLQVQLLDQQEINNINDVLKLASACGTANAMEKETGSVRKEIVDELIDKIRIEVLEQQVFVFQIQVEPVNNFVYSEFPLGNNE